MGLELILRFPDGSQVETRYSGEESGLRRDAQDALELPAPLVAFFLRQLDKHGGATDLTLQRLRYLRDGLLQRRLAPEQASTRALALLGGTGLPPEDAAAVRSFAQDVLDRPAGRAAR